MRQATKRLSLRPGLALRAISRPSHVTPLRTLCTQHSATVSTTTTAVAAEPQNSSKVASRRNWKVDLTMVSNAGITVGDGFPADPVTLADDVSVLINAEFSSELVPIKFSTLLYDVTITRSGHDTLHVEVHGLLNECVNLNECLPRASSRAVVGQPIFPVKITTHGIRMGMKMIRWPARTMNEAHLTAFHIMRATKVGDCEQAVDLIQQAIEKNIPVTPNSLSAVLFLLAGGDNWDELIRQHVRSGVSPSEKVVQGSTSICSYLDKHKMIEEVGVSGLTSLARIAAQTANVEHSLTFADVAARECPPLRHRLFTPALLVCAERHDYNTSVRIGLDMEQKYQLELGDLEYSLILEAAATGDAPYEIVEKLLRRVGALEIPVSMHTATQISAYFKNKNQKSVEASGSEEWVIQETQVTKNGKCNACNGFLSLNQLTTEDYSRLAKSISSLFDVQTARGEFFRFVEWLNEFGPHHAIIDGANIALFGQNYADGQFRVAQIEEMINIVRRRFPNKKPLVVLNECRTHYKDSIPLLRRLRARNEVFVVQGHDDKFWLYAAIMAGKHAVLVSNDRLGDHAYDTQQQKLMLKFQRDHQIGFMVDKKSRLFLSAPPMFTRSVQWVDNKQAWMIPTESNWLCIQRASHVGK